MVATGKNKKTPARTTRPAEKPHFFKILLGDFARRMKLPLRFVRDHLRGSSDAAVVRDVEGGGWDVALERTADGAFLSGGWAEFVQDHALKEREFVVFRYDGGMHFTVVLTFDKAACEKDVVSAERCQESCLCSEVKEETDLEGSFNVPCSPEISPKKVAVPRPNKPKCGYISRQRQSRKDTVKGGPPFSFCSAFPYFVSRMNTRELVKARVLRLPAGFSRAHLPSTRTYMELHNSDGNVWRVNYIPSPRGGSSFCGGWTAFTRGNNLQLGDYCAFELVDPAEFKVSVIRADELTRIQENKTVSSAPVM